MKRTKLKELRESFEEGSITKHEYEKKIKEIEAMPEPKKEQKKEEVEEPKFKSDRILIVILVLIALSFVVFFGLRLFLEKPPLTIEELHELNLKGKLKPDQGYMYNDVYSFVKFDNSWYVQLKSEKGTKFYNIQFRYDPKSLENISIGGKLNKELFNNASSYYVTFNPTGSDFSHVAVAVSDFNQHMTNVFIKQPIAACDRNRTFACMERPIITCNSTKEIVLYVKEANESKVSFDNNCILVEGTGFDLVKEVDRILYVFYNIMD